MEKYNNNSKTLKFSNLRDFYKNKKGRSIIESITEQIVTGKTKQQLKKEKKQNKVQTKTEDKFNTDAVVEQITPTAESEDKSKDLAKDFVFLREGNDTKIANFVEDKNVNDNDIDDIINDINGCTS
jgi:hypothetical protein